MSTPISEFEGTWEEILRRGLELRGRRLRVTVLPSEQSATVASTQTSDTPMLAALREMDALQRGMRMTSGHDTADLLREAREGAMYGDSDHA